MSDQRDKAFVRESIDQGLSSLEGNPLLAQRVLAQANGKEETVVKKKISVSFVLLVMVLFLMASIALAAGLGLFGQLSSEINRDKRLHSLEMVSEPIAIVMTTDDGVTVEIDQAYYEGNRVFISYHLSGNLTSAVLHEGSPDREDIVWETEQENFICAENIISDDPEIQKALEWLDGKGQRWAQIRSIGLHDGMTLMDGTYTDIIGGEPLIQPDGSVIGWKECEIPDECLADELTFKVVLFRNNVIAWQDGTTYRESVSGGEATDIPFTLKRNTRFTEVTGVNSTQEYRATAELKQGLIDLKGTITVKCPAVWVTGMNDFEDDWEDHGVDVIDVWNLYQNGQLVSAQGTEGINCADETTIVYDMLYPHMDNLDGLTLVPEYTRSGEHMDEALTIQAISTK